MLSETVSVQIEKLRFLNPTQVISLAAKYGTPLFVYDEATLTKRAQGALAFPAPFGLTVRYAMKANPLAAILRVLSGVGVHIDASSGYEATRAIRAGIPPSHIMITSQQLPENLQDLVEQGVLFNATSIHQLEAYGRLFPGREISVRLNPGLGSGHTRKTDTGGPTAGFGIWHEQIPDIHQIARAHHLKVTKIHTHIGSGTDPRVWEEAASSTLALVEKFRDVTTVNLGGGFKVARMASESSTDLKIVGSVVAELLVNFHLQTGRKLHLEIEPGTYLVANAGSLISHVQDIVNTGTAGFTFLKLNTGLTEIMRPSLYAAQHPLVVVGKNLDAALKEYVVIGHTCESGDLLTPEPGHADTPATRLLQEAQIGDLVVIEGAGAYCSSLQAAGYNSFPTAAEVMVTASGHTNLIKHSQNLDQLLAAEIA
jgi:diaminopimelate decarboxylase